MSSHSLSSHPISLGRWNFFLLWALVSALGCGVEAPEGPSGSTAPATNTTEVPTVEIEMDSSPSAPAAVTTDDGPLKVGDSAPDFEIEALGGEQIRLADFLGQDRPTILLFDRAHW